MVKDFRRSGDQESADTWLRIIVANGTQIEHFYSELVDIGAGIHTL